MYLLENEISVRASMLSSSGPTGTGKTYTMTGHLPLDELNDIECNSGILPRAVQTIFERIRCCNVAENVSRIAFRNSIPCICLSMGCGFQT